MRNYIRKHSTHIRRKGRSWRIRMLQGLFAEPMPSICSEGGVNIKRSGFVREQPSLRCLNPEDVRKYVIHSRCWDVRRNDEDKLPSAVCKRLESVRCYSVWWEISELYKTILLQTKKNPSDDKDAVAHLTLRCKMIISIYMKVKSTVEVSWAAWRWVKPLVMFSLVDRSATWPANNNRILKTKRIKVCLRHKVKNSKT